MIGLVLETEHCPDGVDLTENHFRPRTNRREPVRLTATDLEDPVALRFLNTRVDLLPFMSKYTTGSLVPRGENLDFAHHAMVLTWQNRLREMLLFAGGDDPIQALILMTDPPINLTPKFNLQDGKPQMLLRCPDLAMFMQMEVAAVALEGAKLVTCEHCGNYFLTGQSTSRRSHATYCSDRCRVAAMRARKKESQ